MNNIGDIPLFQTRKRKIMKKHKNKQRNKKTQTTNETKVTRSQTKEKEEGRTQV